MRFAPIEHPKGFKLRLAYAYSKKRLGKVITPLKVIAARVPESLGVGRAMADFLDKGMRLDPSLRHLVMHLVAVRNSCHFCVDISRAQWLREGGAQAKVQAILDYAANPAFTEAECAALAYADELNQRRDSSDAVFSRLKSHFTEREIVEITWLVAQENFYNFLNKPLGIESDGLCMLVNPGGSSNGVAPTP